MAYLRKHELVLNMGNGRQSLDAETFNGNINPWVVLLHSICLNSRITYGNKISCIVKSSQQYTCMEHSHQLQYFQGQ